MKPKVKRLRESLIAADDGGAACDAINALAKHASQGDPDAKSALAEYINEGQVEHMRDFACASLAEIVDQSDTKHAPAFVQGLCDESVRYWSILGCINTLGRGAYEDLVRVASDESLPVEDRGHAVKCLASHSRQPFDRQLPSDPGEWQDADLRLDEIGAWKKAGCPDGAGHPTPTRHPALDEPKTSLEKAASRLDKRLARQRDESQDTADPTDWLAVADSADIEKVAARWKLPSEYLDFLTRFSPVKAAVDSERFRNGGLQLFGAAELIDAQQGYAFDPVKNKPISDWPQEYVVIASHGGDPFVLDLSASNGKDAPVCTAEHGTGQWVFDREADSFVAFLASIAM